MGIAWVLLLAYFFVILLVNKSSALAIPSRPLVCLIRNGVFLSTAAKAIGSRCLPTSSDLFGEHNMKQMCLAFILTMFSLQSVWAVTTFQFTTKELEDSGTPKVESLTITADVDKRRLRMDPEADTSIVYRADLPEKVILMIDHERRSTRTLNRQQMKDLSAQMSQMMQQVQASLKNLPPEVQKKFRQMQNQPPAAMPKTTADPAAQIKYTKKRGSVGQYSCTWYEVIRGTEITKICATAWKKIKNSRAAFELFQEMFEFQRDMVQVFSRGMPGEGQRSDMMNPVLDIDMKQGFPVQIDTYEQGKLVRSAQLKSVQETSQGTEFFASPNGYDTESFSMDGGRKGRMRRR